jgi:hypothetical protein
MDIRLATDRELRLRVVMQGPTSTEAEVFRQLCAKRSQDRQVFAWEVGSFYFVGPAPNAMTEAAMLKLAEVVEE